MMTFKLAFLYFTNLSIVTIINFPLLACTTAKMQQDQKIIKDIIEAINNDATINYDNAPVEKIKLKILDIIKNTNFLSKKDWDLQNAEVIIKLDNDSKITNLNIGKYTFEVSINPASNQNQIINKKIISGNFSVTNKEKLKSFSNKMLSDFEVSKINKVLGNFNLGQDMTKEITDNIEQALKFQWYDNNIKVIFELNKGSEIKANETKKTNHLIEFLLKSDEIKSNLKNVSFIYTINPVNLNDLNSISDPIPVRVDNSNIATIMNVKQAIDQIIFTAIRNLNNGKIVSGLEMLELTYFKSSDYKTLWQDKEISGEEVIYVQIKAKPDNIDKIINIAKIEVKIIKEEIGKF